MIKDIEEQNFPSYATLSSATVTLNEMGDKTVESTLKIDGQITPDFSYDWAVLFKGEKYIHPLRSPQAAKENTSINSSVDLTFYHWGIYQLKRYYFIELTSIESGTAIADKFIASISLNLGDFVTLLGKVIAYWCGGNIRVELNPTYSYDVEPTTVSISYSYIWDILQKIYELYGVRWQIDADGDSDHYVIKFGYETEEFSHIFQYGFEGGLLKIERQIQSSDIKNIILGRGGDTNLPYRYFKDVDPYNTSFRADPDWVPELANIYFSELRGKAFRDYVRGWKEAHYNGTAYEDRTEAYLKGFTDEKFNPIEYVKDDESIRKYGEFWGSLDNNEDIYPTIQGIEVSPYGRVDQTVDVEQVMTDEIEDTSDGSDVQQIDVPEARIQSSLYFEQYEYKSVVLPAVTVTIPEGMTGTLNDGTTRVTVSPADGDGRNFSGTYAISDDKSYVKAFRETESGSEEVNVGDLTEGTYSIYYTRYIQNTSNAAAKILVGVRYATITLRSADPTKWTNVFDIWVKNIWGTTKLSTETDDEYASRVWGEIIGDRWGNEAKVVFSSGWLSTSEDYEFAIMKVYYDTSKELNGVKSEWRITLAKSDADYDTLGVYLPSVERQGNAGDYFFFTGIDMPQQYVLWAEENLDEYKKEYGLDEYADIKPYFNITLDKIRANETLDDASKIIDAIAIGKSIRLRDDRFIETEENLYIQTAVFTYSDSLLPDVEVTLSDEYTTVTSAVSTIQAEIETLHTQIGSIGNIDEAVAKVANKKYLRKDAADTANCKITFKQGWQTEGYVNSLWAGKGAGLDALGNIVVESLKCRSAAEFLELIINRLTAIEGDQLLTEADTIESIDDLGDNCYGLHLRSKWDGYFTAQADNNVIKGIVNSLAKGSGTYYTSWMRVNSVNTANNYIEVTLYNDEDTPAGKNYPPSEMMNIARWGNQTDETRQSCIYLSSTEGRIVKLVGVTKPIIDESNYGTVLGNLPDFLKDDIRIDPNKDYLYAMGVVCRDFIQVDYQGNIIPTYVDRGKWVSNPEEQYRCKSMNNSGQYETSDVWHLGCKWRCQKDGATTEPAWNNTDWAMIEGNPNFTVDFLEPEQLYDLDNFSMPLTIVAYLYNQDVTADILDSDVMWTRYSEDADGNERVTSDNLWALNHANSGKAVELVYSDLDADTSTGFPKVIRFTASVTLRDGMGDTVYSDSVTKEIS